MDRMRRVMMLTFGRIGWRRHELLATFRQPGQPHNSAQLEVDLRPQDGQAPVARDWLDSWDKHKLLVFARSQAGRSLRSSPRPQAVLKRLDPQKAVPPVSIWGKPFAAKVARSKEKKWWRQVENRILPPLPRSEWDLLTQLATGQAGPRWDVPPRRAPAAVTPLAGAPAAKSSGIETWEWEKYLTGPIRVIERPQSRRFRLPPRPGTLQQTQPEARFDGPAIGFHKYTPRFWRRLYEDIWQLSSVMEKKTGRPANAWHVTWGGAPLRPVPPSASNLEFFEGVDSKGALLKRPGEGSHKAT
ncbi:hypothetical protein SCUCBS95973_001331 [Sporothrix curviconia]|uniref:Mitochondrial zinc maintenance protein 1, mitochondrial n=1 Tax=Sporothrix curviconia TaxID=1260050 RepID=A0ABP0AXW6_9PEZI